MKGEKRGEDHDGDSVELFRRRRILDKVGHVEAVERNAELVVQAA